MAATRLVGSSPLASSITRTEKLGYSWAARAVRASSSHGPGSLVTSTATTGGATSGTFSSGVSPGAGAPESRPSATTIAGEATHPRLEAGGITQSGRFRGVSRGTRAYQALATV